MTDLELEGLPKGDHPSVDDFASLFINDTPLLDVRAPVEFEQGAFPNATNIPLMTDAEREAVGIKYKEQGQDAAILLGAKLVTPELQAERKQQWADFFTESAKKGGGVLYCFRGGLRSQISQQWVFDETGIDHPRVDGGYKAMRRFLIDSLERISKEMPMIVLGGRTGSGKTRLLKQLDNSIDLEGLANHRGSAFGPTATPQPTQINFENCLAIELLKKEAAGHKVLVIEDEARNVGSMGVPTCLHETMQNSPLVMLEVSDADRNKVSIDEYILDTQKSFDEVYGEDQGEVELSKHLLDSLEKIKKRLGGVRYEQARQQMQDAIALRKVTGSTEGFVPLVNDLLVDYYDPMYDYQSMNKQERVSFRGSFDEVLAHLTS
ncbi:MAG: tRNA 2-selenouridine(34) synthase MnmH [Cocleimonas sp.]